MSTAFDPARHPGPLPSPCIGLCVMTPQTGLCQGCARTIDEIIGWSSASEADKSAIWLAIGTRRADVWSDAGQKEDEPDIPPGPHS